jgi:hypothetical protein
MPHPGYGGARSIALERTAIVVSVWQIYGSWMNGRDPCSRGDETQKLPQAGRRKRGIGVAEPFLRNMGLTVRQRIDHLPAPR